MRRLISFLRIPFSGERNIVIRAGAGCIIITALLVTCGVCSIFAVETGIVPDTSATEDAQTAVAEEAFWLTATAVTHTPTDTPTSTFTPTDTFTPTPTIPTDTPTDTFTPTATVPTDTPTDTLTPSPTVPTDTPTLTFTPTDTFTPTNTFPPTLTPESVLSDTVYVNTEQLNVRSGPGADFEIQGQFVLGDQVVVDGQTGNWFLVRGDDLRGWIAGGFTSPNDPLITPSATRTVSERAESIIKNTRGTGLRDRDVETVIANDRVVTLRFRLLEHLFESSYRDQANEDFTLLVCNLRANGFTTQTFQFTGLIPVVDSFGNESWAEGVEMILEPATAARINCSNPDQVILENIAETYTINPLLR